MGKKKVRLKPGTIPYSAKIPRIDPGITSPMDLNPVWHIGTLDIEGPWGWNTITERIFFDEILPKIRDFESMFWKDIFRRNNHEVEVSQISISAQKRLVHLNLEDTENLVSLRLTGKQRIWGIRVANILRILWWDPDHEVYPTELRHT